MELEFKKCSDFMKRLTKSQKRYCIVEMLENTKFCIQFFANISQLDLLI